MTGLSNHSPMRISLLLAIFLWAGQLFGETGYYNYSPLAREAYQRATCLRMKEATALVAKLKKQEPGNLIAYHIEDYIDFFNLYVSEDANAFERLKSNRDRRLSIVADGNSDSPWRLFVQADIRLHWALLRFRFGEYLSGFSEVNKAAKLLERNRKLFPQFMPNQKDLGILHAAVGTVPDQYKWGLKLLSSLSGTIEEGRKELESVLIYSQSNDFVFKDEVTALYALLLLHLDNQGEEAWKVITKGGLQPISNPLHCFVMAHLAIHTGRNNRAIELLADRPRSRTFIAFPYLDYMQGLTKLRRLDKDAAIYFQQFLTAFKGRHYIKEAYQKIAWSALINERPDIYRQKIKLCMQKGQAEAGGDKSALREAQAGVMPNITLLKARLLFDGAYFEQALALLQSKNVSEFKEAQFRLEYTYRLGRVLHGLKRYQEALDAYRQTIASGRYERYFFACNAALQMGLIYETLGDKANAKSSFELCLSMDPEDYKTSLQQQAKAGLNRLK